MFWILSHDGQPPSKQGIQEPRTVKTENFSLILGDARKFNDELERCGQGASGSGLAVRHHGPICNGHMTRFRGDTADKWGLDDDDIEEIHRNARGVLSTNDRLDNMISSVVSGALDEQYRTFAASRDFSADLTMTDDTTVFLNGSPILGWDEYHTKSRFPDVQRLLEPFL